MDQEKKLMKVHQLLTEVSDVLVDRFFDLDSENLLDEKIEVLTALKTARSLKKSPSITPFWKSSHPISIGIEPNIDDLTTPAFWPVVVFSYHRRFGFVGGKQKSK